MSAVLTKSRVRENSMMKRVEMNETSSRIFIVLLVFGLGPSIRCTVVTCNSDEIHSYYLRQLVDFLRRI